VLRVKVDGEDAVGFIEISSSTTLAESRTKICAEVEGIASIGSNFMFLLPDAVPVSRKQESGILAREFLPVVTIRDQSTSSVLIPRPRVVSGNRNKVIVSFLGETYQIWITSGFTFAQLRRESARYWSLSPEHVVLMDEEGCSWPESCLVSDVQQCGMLNQRKIVLVRKPCSTNHTTSQNFNFPEAGDTPRSPGSTITINNLLQNNNHIEVPHVLEKSPSRSATVAIEITQENEGGKLGDGVETKEDKANGESVVIERYADLWRIYTFYCCSVDVNRPFSMDRRGFLAMLQDCRMVNNREFSPAKLGLIFAANCKETKRMKFDQFLDALMGITKKLQKRPNLRAAAPYAADIMQRVKSDELLMTSFVQLLMQRIIPFSLTWNTQKWKLQTNTIYQEKRIQELLRTFEGPFYELFRFYAPAVRSNKLDMEKDACFHFATFQTFALDFQFSELNVRPHLAEIYLCSAQYDGEEQILMQHHSCTPMWDWPVLYWRQFLDALVRVSFHAFPDLAASEAPDQAVKALIQHFAKCMRRSFVMDLIAKRRDMSTQTAGLLAGTKRLINLYLVMWQREGQPDYQQTSKPGQAPSYKDKSRPSAITKVPKANRTSKKTTDGRKILEDLLKAEEERAANGEAAGQAVSALLGLSGVNGFSDGTFGLLDVDFEMESMMSDFAEGMIAAEEEQERDDNQEANENTERKRRISDSSSGLAATEEDVKQQHSTSSSASAGLSPACSNDLESDFDEEEKDADSQPPLSPTYITKNEHSLQPLEFLGRVSQPTYSLLCRGSVFLKHGRKGKPRKRFIWCDDRLEKIFWCAAEKKPQRRTAPKARSIPISELQGVAPGLQTENFQKILRPRKTSIFSRKVSGLAGKELQEKEVRSFSILTRNRTLDLEATSQILRGEWIDALQEVLRLNSAT